MRLRPTRVRLAAKRYGIPKLDSKRDPFSILGVPPTASPQEIRNAYRQLCIKHHPDVRQGDVSSAVRKAQEASMAEINLAYEKARRIAELAAPARDRASRAPPKSPFPSSATTSSAFAKAAASAGTRASADARDEAWERDVAGAAAAYRDASEKLKKGFSSTGAAARAKLFEQRRQEYMDARARGEGLWSVRASHRAAAASETGEATSTGEAARAARDAAAGLDGLGGMGAAAAAAAGGAGASTSSTSSASSSSGTAAAGGAGGGGGRVSGTAGVGSLEGDDPDADPADIDRSPKDGRPVEGKWSEHKRLPPWYFGREPPPPPLWTEKPSWEKDYDGYWRVGNTRSYIKVKPWRWIVHPARAVWWWWSGRWSDAQLQMASRYQRTSALAFGNRSVLQRLLVVGGLFGLFFLYYSTHMGYRDEDRIFQQKELQVDTMMRGWPSVLQGWNLERGVERGGVRSANDADLSPDLLEAERAYHEGGRAYAEMPDGRLPPSYVEIVKAAEKSAQHQAGDAGLVAVRWGGESGNLVGGGGAAAAAGGSSRAAGSMDATAKASPVFGYSSRALRSGADFVATKVEAARSDRGVENGGPVRALDVDRQRAAAARDAERDRVAAEWARAAVEDPALLEEAKLTWGSAAARAGR